MNFSIYKYFFVPVPEIFFKKAKLDKNSRKNQLPYNLISGTRAPNFRILRFILITTICNMICLL